MPNIGDDIFNPYRTSTPPSWFKPALDPEATANAGVGINIPVSTPLDPGATDASTTTPPPATDTPPNPYTPGPDTVATQGGYNPDWNALINSDSGYAAAQAAATARRQTLATQRKLAIQSLLTQFGRVPGGFKDKYGDLADLDAGMIARNPYSTSAQIERGRLENMDVAQKGLAGRGILRSGALGSETSRVNYESGLREYNATNELMGRLNDAVNSYLNGQEQVNSGLASSLGDAASRVYANPANRPRDGVNATRDTALSSQYGMDIYRDPDGNYWRMDNGVPVRWTAPAAGSQAGAPPEPAPPAPPYSGDPYAEANNPDYVMNIQKLQGNTSADALGLGGLDSVFGNPIYYDWETMRKALGL